MEAETTALSSAMRDLLPFRALVMTQPNKTLVAGPGYDLDLRQLHHLQCGNECSSDVANLQVYVYVELGTETAQLI